VTCARKIPLRIGTAGAVNGGTYTRGMRILWRSSFVGVIVLALMPLAPAVASGKAPSTARPNASVMVGPGMLSAAVRSDFDPGNIISDAIFYDPSTMSAADIQTFLNERVATCRLGYTCLRDYRQSFDTRVARVEGCTEIPAGNAVPAAEIIRIVSQACGVNPRVILTLLEKEQGLVSDTWPTERQYRSATGYGCPDTAACDTAYYGFFNQVYNAARQFKNYQYSPNYWNYRAGRTNTILWHPNASCGTSQVYITNQATAGLYNYTPYRPNNAALNALYGTGDGCSSYGNRNFWRIFTDWFGSTTIPGVMVRASNSLQIWLLSNGQKFPINNPEIYASLAPLGGVSVVSAEYLASLVTKPEVSRFIGDSTGNLYLVGSGRRYHFDSCSRVTDWGFNCPDWTTLEDRIVAMLPSSGELSNVVQDSGQRYWQIVNGTRRQAVDETALAAVDGNPLTFVSDSTLAALPISRPILRDDIIVQDSTTSSYWINSGGLRSLPASLYRESTLDTSLPLRTLLAQSTALLSATGTATGVFASGGTKYLLTETGKSLIPVGVEIGIAATAVSAEAIASIPTMDRAIGDPTFVRAVGTRTVFLLRGGARQGIASWDDYVWLAGPVSNQTIYVVPSPTVAAIPETGPYLRPGSIVRATGTPAAYVVDGAEGLYPLESYDVTAQLGIGRVAREIPQAAIDALIKQPRPISRVVSCEGKLSLGVDGTLREANSTVAGQYALNSPTILDPTTCSVMRSGPPLTPFIKKSTGAVYYVVDGLRRHIPNADVLRALGGAATNLTSMSDDSVRNFPADLPLLSEVLSQRPLFMRADGTPAVYIVRNSVRSMIQSWEDYLYAARGVANSSINVSPKSVVDEIPTGPMYLRPGKFVRPNDSPGVFLLDGSSRRIIVGSIDPITALGGATVGVVSPTDLAAYAVSSPSHLTSALTCGGETYIGLGGLLYRVTDEVREQYGTPTTTVVRAETCAGLPQATGSPGKFLLAAGGRVYLMNAGLKHHVRSPAGFESLGGEWSTLIKVSDYTLNQFTTGSAVG
jgi:hypothetical protein